MRAKGPVPLLVLLISASVSSTAVAQWPDWSFRGSALGLAREPFTTTASAFPWATPLSTIQYDPGLQAGYEIEFKRRYDRVRQVAVRWFAVEWSSRFPTAPPRISDRAPRRRKSSSGVRRK